MKKHFLLLALAAICSLSVWAQTERPFVSNLTGTPSASVQSLSASLSWAYNVPFSLSGAYSSFASSGSCSPSFANGVLTLTYNSYGSNSYQAIQIDNGGSNVSSFSFEAKSDNVSNNPVIVVHSWGGAGDVVADKVDIEADWKEFVVVPQYVYSKGSNYAKGSAISGSFGTSVGCMSFLPIAESSVTSGKTYIRNAYFQLSSRAGVTSTVKIVRKNGSEPTSDTDGTVLSFNGNETTFTDNQDLLEGQTYYYRVFGTYNGVAYQSNAISVTMPGTPKIDPQLSFGLATKSLVKDATFNKPVSFVSGFDKTKVVYTSSNTGVAEIDANGLVTAKAVGTTTISAHSDAYEGYAVGNASYTLTVIELPVATNLEIKNAANEVVPLSWNIPGLVDMSNPVTPICEEQESGTTPFSYANGVASVQFSFSTNYRQQGIGFNIPNVTNIEWVSAEFKGSATKSMDVWIGVVEAEGAHAIWNARDAINAPLKADWSSTGKETPHTRYWNSPWVGNPVADAMKQIVVMANAGVGGSSGTLDVRNVRYHVKDANDQGVAKVVLVRKQGESAATSVSDADKVFELSSDLAFSFTDKDSKTSGRYWYTVFCLDEDGNYSAGTSVSYDLVVKEKHSVTYELGTGVTGVAPTQEPQVEGQTFAVAAGTGFKKQGFKFSKWNDGTKDYMPGDEYIMPDNAVQFTPVWEAVVVPAVTNLNGNGVNDVVTLSWNTPGLMDIANTTVNQAQDCSWSLSQCSWTKVNDNKELEVSYTFSGDQFNGPALMFTSNRTDIDSVHFEYKGSGSAIALEFTPFLYGTNSDAHERYAGNPSSSDITNVTDWTPATLVPIDPLWGIGVTYNHQPISSVSFYVAQHESGTTNFTLNLRNIMVYSNTQTPVKEVVVLRKAGSAIMGFDDPDAENLASGLLNNLVDDEEKEPNETYYYAVYTVDFDGNYSEPQTFSYKNVVIATYAVVFDANGATGTVPTMANQQEGAQFTLPDKGNLAKSDQIFAGWNDGDVTYPAGATYTMPNYPVTFKAQWASSILLPANLDYTNYAYTNSPNGLWVGDGGTCIDLGNETYSDPGTYADWYVHIVPGAYTVTYRVGSPEWGNIVYLYLKNRSTGEIIKTETTGPIAFYNFQTYEYTWDLTSLQEGEYIVRAESNYGSAGAHTKVHYVNFKMACTENVAITTQPVGATIGLGEMTTLSVAATGTAPLAYQWQESSDNNTFTDMTGSIGDRVTIRPSVEGTKYYRCYVSNECSNATSMAVAVTAEDRGFLLDEWDENISATIEAYYGSTSKINLQRTLSSASLNTLCLPFAMSAEQLATYNMNAELYRFTGATVSQGGDDVILTLNFVDATEILAGYPYLIRPSVDVVNPIIEGSSITVKTPKSEGDENVLFQGIYAPTTLIANDENNLFVGANSTLFWPNEDATMPGLRAYFQILTPAAKVATRAQMKFNQHVITDLNLVRPARAEHYKYIDHNGRLIIVRDGKAYGVLGSQLAR